MNYWPRILAFALVFLLTACSGKDEASIELSGLNYTDTEISNFAVNNHGGHPIEPHGGGGAFVCCVIIPRQWHAGIKVTVRWTEDERVLDSWKERIVKVPEYTREDIGAFAVHFYPGDIVKVLVTTKIEGHPDYPYPRPD